MKPSPPRPTPQHMLRRTALAVLVGLAVLSGLAPVLQGCGDDLVIGGNLVIPTLAPTSAGGTPTPTPIDDDDDDF